MNQDDDYRNPNSRYHERKYHEYKKKYLEIKRKKKFSQNGGWGPDATLINMVHDMQDYCDTVDIENQKAKLKKIFKNEKYAKILRDSFQLNIPKDSNLWDWENSMDWNKIHMAMCNFFYDVTKKLGPHIEKLSHAKEIGLIGKTNLGNLKERLQKNLQNVDVDHYLNFAKNNHMGNDSVDKILAAYYANLQNIGNIIEEEKHKTKEAEKQLSKTEHEAEYEAKHSCIGECEYKNDLLHGDYCRCETKPYKWFGMQYDWDICHDCNKPKLTNK